MIEKATSWLVRDNKLVSTERPDLTVKKKGDKPENYKQINRNYISVNFGG